jgi:hypothetical protein
VNRLALALLTALLAAPASLADVVDCAALSATQRRQAETIGACVPGAPKALCLPATDEGMAELVDLLASEANYQPGVPCTAARQVDDLGIMVAAGPGDGACTAALAGQQVDNPQPRRQVALRWWRAQLNDRIGQRAAERAAEVERERVRATTTAALPEDAAGP